MAHQTFSAARLASLTLAVAVSPITAPLVLFAIGVAVPWFPLTRRNGGLEDRLRDLSPVAIIVMVIAYVATLLVALPAHRELRRRNKSQLRHYLCVGLLTGVGVVALFSLFVYVVEGSTADWPLWVAGTFAGTGAICGAVCGAVFWFVAVRSYERGEA